MTTTVTVPNLTLLITMTITTTILRLRVSTRRSWVKSKRYDTRQMSMAKTSNFEINLDAQFA
jgi:hypothetical protein